MRFFIFLIILFSSALAQASVSLREFKSLVEIFHKEYDQELASQKSVFKVNHTAPGANPDMWWNLPNVHASYSSHTENGIRTHFIFLFGGYAKIEGMTIEGIANTLCHELGHGIGGAPFKDKVESYLVSTEGQADYYATKVCLKRILKHLPVKRTPAPLDGFVDAKCRQYSKTPAELQMCYRSFETLENERLFFRIEEDGKDTFYDRPDLSVVAKVNTAPDFYPDGQCRLDTMVNGVLGLERPKCWYKP